MTANVERAYQNLREAGFTRGNMLQLVSQLLAVDPRGTGAAVQRFRRVADHLQGAGERVDSRRYDKIAMLALTQEAPAQLVDQVLRYRDRLREAKPRPPKDMAFSLVAGIVLAEDSQRAGKRSAGDEAALRAIQAILDAQQAVMVATIATSTRRLLGGRRQLVVCVRGLRTSPRAARKSAIGVS